MLLVDRLFDGRHFYHGSMARNAALVGSRNNHQWCHLTSDTSEYELHEFALRLGMKRSWFDKDHYDLTPGKRALALRMGAVEASSEEIVKAIRNWKA